MAWQDFVDIDFIALNAKHATGAISAILTFSLVGWVVERVKIDGPILMAIHLAEKVVVASCIGYLTITILWEVGGRLITVLKGQKNGRVPPIVDA
ncbi:MAG TPA: hypothetical protein VGO68_08290 [Pyrinomonadaceae bacterium]|jgi:hypothetical protein|nr:hypothetical protein [Pyrinomonadaceae bacterium]